MTPTNEEQHWIYRNKATGWTVYETITNIYSEELTDGFQAHRVIKDTMECYNTKHCHCRLKLFEK